MPFFDLSRLTLGLIVIFCVFVPLESLFALRPARIFRPGFLTDTLHYFLSGSLRKIMTLLAAILLIHLLGFLVYPPLRAWILGWPGWGQMIVAFVLQDLAAYWGHRIMHQVPWLWPFHAVHHSSEHLDWMAANRVHPVDQTIIRSFGFIPLYLLGFTKETFGGLLVIEGIWAIFIHANVRW